ncbi:MAG TPA: hypothetical protein VMB05_14790 [Solirubrobacteraceae bacterium]|nr:hypothetical protein [Solirubrobacteraceae bacterium]HUB73067.1 hypothetical protein [Solirubrobacteraceae bacterium]
MTAQLDRSASTEATRAGRARSFARVAGRANVRRCGALLSAYAVSARP